MKVPKMKKIVQEKAKGGMVEFDQSLPSISFDEKQLPEIKNWNVGKTYTITLQVKQTRSSIIGYGSKKGLHEASFEVQSVGSNEEPDGDEK